ncbi:unnamed protein product [Effrenium voratum]|uniref:galactinol--sucrose galactosyltransferase n=1 Tax=Effrenium voratum TaxID=2562239 RepID=A0AA36ITP0_9DINO|nr:unnamed protein product [Effrenium voratum]CAJ1443581.1 unnamed protein product [Effrenium voratum]
MALVLASHDESLHIQQAEVGDCTETTVTWKGSGATGSFQLFPNQGILQLVALHRHKPPWTQPKVLTQLSQMPGETLFAIARLSSGRLLVLCPLATSNSVASLRGSDLGLDNFQLELHAEATNVPVLLVLECDTDAAKAAFLAARRCCEVSGGRLREEKKLPELFTRWGWCSWDACGVLVSRRQLEAMSKHRPAWMVLDDGWQEEVKPEQWRRWLHTPQSGFQARPSFGDLKDLAQHLAEASIQLLVWHTLLGYWGGVAPGRGYKVHRALPTWPRGLQENCPQEVDVWEGDFSVLDPEDMERFYTDFYEFLASAGVAGVKCDGHFLADDVLLSLQGREAIQAAHLAAASAHFAEAPVISCMGMTLRSIGEAVLSRVSDDHAYPGVPEDAPAVARHIYHCSVNSLWLAPYLFCDWDDMLKTSEWHGPIHAAARAVAGAPVYASDAAECFDMEVLRPLLVPGTDKVVPCEGSGRPIDRQLFEDDPLSTPSPWWIVNSTASGFIAAGFGLHQSEARMTATIFPHDLRVEKAHACLQVDLHSPGHSAELTDGGWDVQTMHYMGFAVLALAPIVAFKGTRLAVFGLAGVWNPTGTLCHPPVEAGGGLRLTLRSCASRLVLWCSGRLAAKLNGEAVQLEAGTNSLALTSCEVTLS